MSQNYDKLVDKNYTSFLDKTIQKQDSMESDKADRKNAYYNAENLLYPLNLADAKYGDHRVVFCINVQGGGKIVRENTRQTVELPKNRLLRKMSGETLAKNVAEAVGIKAIAPNKRLAAAIHLYVPEAVTKSYSVQWGEEDMGGLLETAAQSILKAGDAYSKSKGWEGIKDAAVASAGTAIEGGAASLLKTSQYVQRSLNITPGNSKAQLLFNQVDFGSFTFEYRFAPTSEAEANSVLKIIRTFRHHMLPEFLTEENFLYVYPSEFDISYYFKDEENPYMEKHITAVLTSMNVNYNPNGQFTTFANGMPTHIGLTLQFKELGSPTKESSPDNESGA